MVVDLEPFYKGENLASLENALRNGLPEIGQSDAEKWQSCRNNWRAEVSFGKLGLVKTPGAILAVTTPKKSI